MTSDTAQELEAAIYSIVAKQLNVSVGRSFRDAHLVDDLQADLVTLTQLALALEDGLEIEIVDAEWIQVEYVGQVVEYVRACRERGMAKSEHEDS